MAEAAAEHKHRGIYSPRIWLAVCAEVWKVLSPDAQKEATMSGSVRLGTVEGELAFKEFKKWPFPSEGELRDRDGMSKDSFIGLARRHMQDFLTKGFDMRTGHAVRHPEDVAT
jgi:hypothetical protein